MPNEAGQEPGMLSLGVKHEGRGVKRVIRAFARIVLFAVVVGVVLAVLDPPIVRGISALMGISASGGPAHELEAGRIALRWVDVALVLLVMMLVARLERVPMTSYGLPVRRRTSADVGRGVACGVGAVLVICGCLVLSRTMLVGPPILSAWAGATSGLRWGVAFLAVAALEELSFRGYALSTLARGVGFWPAALLLSALFTAAHLRNAGETVAGLLAVFLFGVFFCALVRRTGALWFGIGLHAGWDWAQSFLMGVPDSGTIAVGRALAPSFEGSVWLTGGSAGPEGSVITLALLIVAIALLVRARRAGAQTFAFDVEEPA